MRKCVIPNYIPHKSNKYVKYQRWYKEYEKNLCDLYSIFIETLEQRYDHKDVNFHDFCYFIFKNSSKYILKY